MKLPFKSGQAFIEYCHSQFPAKPQKGQARPAVIPEPGFLDIEQHVSTTEDGRYRASLLVCGSLTGFHLMSDTPKPGGESLQSGDTVVWMPFKKLPLLSPKLSSATGDKRSDWIGFIVAKIAPEIDSETGQFTVLSRYQ